MTNHRIIQSRASYWTIEALDHVGEIWCKVVLRDKEGAELWSNETPHYRKGLTKLRERKARTFAGTIIANVNSGYEITAPVRIDGIDSTAYWSHDG